LHCDSLWLHISSTRLWAPNKIPSSY
jgi:hypothetical protein